MAMDILTMSALKNSDSWLASMDLSALRLEHPKRPTINPEKRQEHHHLEVTAPQQREMAVF
jgi:hypothetical protein